MSRGEVGGEAAMPSPEALATYVEVARAQYQQEEERWRTAQEKAKAVFAVAALVATLMFSRVEWAGSQVPVGHLRCAWLISVVLTGLSLSVALAIAGSVFVPKAAWGLEPGDRALEKIVRIPVGQVRQYLGELYVSTAERNTSINDRQLGWIRAAVILVTVSVVIAVAQVLFVAIVC